MYCSKCGKEIHDEAVICPHCGCAVPGRNITQDAPNIGFAILGFFFPLIGLILYLVYKDNKPLQARSAGKGALIGFIVSVVLGVIGGCSYSLLLYDIFSSY